MKRIPWLVVGLVIGFLAAVVASPTHYTNSGWHYHPERYYWCLWWPAVGALGGAFIDLSLAGARRLSAWLEKRKGPRNSLS